MGNALALPPYPLDDTALCFDLGPEQILETGMTQAACHYEQAQAPFWNAVREKMAKSTEAKEKFNESNAAGYMRQYPAWKEADFVALRDQFMSFDVNEDGMIDYDELNSVLDKLGDRTSSEDRKAYFASIDTDHSSGVDFEEFLELVHKVLTGHTEIINGFGKLYTESIAQSTACNKLSVFEQLAAGLI